MQKATARKQSPIARLIVFRKKATGQANPLKDNEATSVSPMTNSILRPRRKSANPRLPVLEIIVSVTPIKMMNNPRKNFQNCRSL
jgi:hypothetical protein